jgi:hypothetical protein
MRMNVKIVFRKTACRWIICDVAELIVVVQKIADAKASGYLIRGEWKEKQVLHTVQDDNSNNLN